MFSYQAQVSDQLSRYRQGQNSGFSPFAQGVFDLALRQEVPLWAVSFADKNCELLSDEDRFSIVINDPDILSALGFAEAVRSLTIEREVLLDHQGQLALIERQIQVDQFGTATVHCVSTIAFDYNRRSQVYCLNWQTHDKEHVSMGYMDIPSVRRFVAMELPISYLAGITL